MRQDGGMENQDALSPDVALPGQEPVDLEPSIEPEPEATSSSSAKEDPGQAGASDDPEVGNTLINPDNS
jgi:hypothetical protein